MRRKAFSLIEIAIVLIILGIILSIGTSFMIQFVKWNKRKETKEKLSSAVESVIGFAETYGYLPDSSKFKEIYGEKDGFSQDFVYVYSYKLTKGFLDQYRSHGYDVSICDVKSVPLKVIDHSRNSTLYNVAFFIFSKGEDYKSDTYCNNNRIDSSGECNGTVETDYSKDYLKAITLSELKYYLNCSGMPLKILNNSLPTGEVGVSYDASVFAEGGLPFLSGGKYEWCYDAPNGLGGLTVSPDKKCSLNQWGQADELKISGSPTDSGSYQLKVCVRDDNGPEAEDKYVTCKWFVITINSNGNESSNSSCKSYTLSVSVSSRPWWAHPISTSVQGQCVDTGRTGGTYYYNGNLTPDTIIEIMEDWWCSNNNIRIFDKAEALDKNRDCSVEIICNNGNCQSE